MVNSYTNILRIFTMFSFVDIVLRDIVLRLTIVMTLATEHNIITPIVGFLIGKDAPITGKYS